MTGNGPWSLGDDYRDDPRFVRATPEVQAKVQRFHDDGIAVFRGLVPRHVVDEALAATGAAFAEADTDGPKLEEAWRRSPAIRALATCPEVVDAVELLHGRRAIPFQTLSFRRGSQQRVHADSVHFDTVPSGWMCGVWVALEDVGPTQGPLVYVPGSHRDVGARTAEIGRVGAQSYAGYESELARTLGLDDGGGVTFDASSGDVLVWAAHLVHGGAAVTDPSSTRWSQVTHYFFDGCTYVTPMHSDPARGTVALRDALVDLRDLRRVQHVDRGAGLVRRSGGQATLVGPDDTVTMVDRWAGRARSAVAAARWWAGSVPWRGYRARP